MPTFSTALRVAIVVATLLLPMVAASKVPTPLSLEEGFDHPPEITKPGCYWYWISDNISKEGITRDLEAMAHVGIGEAYIGNVDVNHGETGDVKALTEEWWGMVEHAVREGQRLGVNIGIFNCPGWSQSGGPWVSATETMRYVTSSETHIHGPTTFDDKLPAPKELFQDIATLAFPAPELDTDSLAAHSVRVHTTPELPQVAAMFDGKLDTACSLPTKEDVSIVIDAETDAPYTARSLTIHSTSKPLGMTCEVQAANEDGTVFHTVRTVSFEHLNPAYNNGGFMPFAPMAVSFSPVTSRHFRFVLSRIKGAGAVGEIELSGKAKLESYVEKELGRTSSTPHPAWDLYMWPPQVEPDRSGLVVPLAQVVNLSDKVAPDGTLRWDVPAGDWIILRNGMTPTGAKNNPATAEGQGYEVDKMSRSLVGFHFDQFVGKLLNRMPVADRKSLKRVVADSYEQGAQNWTDGLAQDFQKRYGYDPLPFLPTLTGRIVGDADQSDRFLWDLRRLIADRISFDYVGGLREKCEQHGLDMWLENYGHWGFTGEFLQYGGSSSEVSGEFWTSGDLGDIELRDASSAAHTYGKTLVHAEAWTGGWPAWTLTPWDLKKRGDWAMTEGINRFVLHVYIEQPTERTPGINAWFGTEFNRHNTWFNAAEPFFNYLRRNNSVLQQGLHVADAAYFIGEDAPKMDGVRNPALPPGYSFDYINADVIEQRLQVKDGRFVLPDGMSYRVLVLPPQDTMRPECLRKIRDLVAAGGTVVGSPPLRSPSREHYPECDREVENLVGELWKDCDGTATHTSIMFGQGRVFRGVTMQTVFDQLDVQPDLCGVSAKDAPFIHRHLPDGDAYFISNQLDKGMQAKADFRVDGRQPELWDAVTGERRDLPEFTHGGGRTQVPLEFAPRQSLLVVFHKGLDAASEPKEGARNFDSLKSVGEVTGPWELHFDPKWGGPESVQFDQLVDWTQRPEEGIKHYSGTAIYKKMFDLPTPLVPRQRMYLDLGTVHSMARIRLNGHDLGLAWCAPWHMDITSAVNASGNQLEIEVINPWANRIIGDLSLTPEKRYASETVPGRKVDSPLVPSGLVGPVRLMTE